MLLRSAIAAGVEYVDIEADVASQIPRYGNTKRIISYHDFSGTPDNLEDLHAAMVDEDADIVKIATMANSFSRQRADVRSHPQRQAADHRYLHGEIGTITRILANRFGSPFTYATFSTDKSMAPGQLNWKDMQTLYDVKSIDQNTELFGVIADPVAHSYSPMIHNAAFESEKLNAPLCAAACAEG